MVREINTESFEEEVKNVQAVFVYDVPAEINITKHTHNVKSKHFFLFVVLNLFLLEYHLLFQLYEYFLQVLYYHFVNLPISIPIKTDFIVDGECIITYDDFLRINDKLPTGIEKYKNPRNLASGSLSVLDSKDIKDRPLKFIAWRVISGLEDEKFFSNINIKITEYGFEVVPYFTYTPGTSDEIDLPDMLNAMRDKANTKRLIALLIIDGIVFAFDSIELAKKLGRTSHHFNHSIAYKFEDDRYETKAP